VIRTLLGERFPGAVFAEPEFSGDNAAGVAIAAGALYPLTGLLLNPMIASAAMTFSSLSVIGNALRLRSLAVDSR
jgi:cation transport ATPase